jgi:hypothetical protein
MARLDNCDVLCHDDGSQPVVAVRAITRQPYRPEGGPAERLEVSQGDCLGRRRSEASHPPILEQSPCHALTAQGVFGVQIVDV